MQSVGQSCKKYVHFTPVFTLLARCEGHCLIKGQQCRYLMFSLFLARARYSNKQSSNRWLKTSWRSCDSLKCSLFHQIFFNCLCSRFNNNNNNNDGNNDDNDDDDDHNDNNNNNNNNIIIITITIIIIMIMIKTALHYCLVDPPHAYAINMEMSLTGIHLHTATQTNDILLSSLTYTRKLYPVLCSADTPTSLK